MSFLLTFIHLEWRRNLAQGGALWLPILFYAMILLSMVLALPAHHALLQEGAPGLLWSAALFSYFLSAPRVFFGEREYGILPQWLLVGEPLSLIVLGKILSHWLITGLPLALATPFFGLFLLMDTQAAFALTAGLLVGSLLMSTLILLLAVILLATRTATHFLVLLILPWLLPIIVFGAASTEQLSESLWFLLGLSLLMIPLIVISASFLLREIIQSES